MRIAPLFLTVALLAGCSFFDSAGEHDTLTGSWVLVRAESSGSTHDFSRLSERATAQFSGHIAESGGAILSGFSACNNYTARYHTESAAITVSALASTDIACAGDTGAAERALFEGLRTAEHYEVAHGLLVLFHADGRLVFAAH